MFHTTPTISLRTNNRENPIESDPTYAALPCFAQCHPEGAVATEGSPLVHSRFFAPLRMTVTPQLKVFKTGSTLISPNSRHNFSAIGGIGFPSSLHPPAQSSRREPIRPGHI